MWAIAMSIAGWFNNKNRVLRWQECEGKGKAQGAMRAVGKKEGSDQEEGISPSTSSLFIKVI